MADLADEGQLSLYFDLKEGEKADLEVVAQAAIHWVAALRAAALEIEHTATIRVELVDAVEGSLSLNTILDWAEDQLKRIETGSGRHPRLKKLAVAAAVFMVFTGGPTFDHYFGDDTVNLSDEDRERLDEFIRITSDKPAVEESRRKFFRAVEKDPAIRGVGVTEERGERPKNLIPSSQFAERGGLWISEEEEHFRTVWPVLDVTLVGPMLVSKPRSWKFRPEGLPEFSAKMQDPKFLAALEEDHVRERLRVGIQMTIRLKVEEQKIGGVWVVRRGGRSVVEVLSPLVR